MSVKSVGLAEKEIDLKGEATPSKPSIPSSSLSSCSSMFIEPVTRSKQIEHVTCNVDDDVDNGDNDGVDNADNDSVDKAGGNVGDDGADKHLTHLS
eukprot:913873-Ditylum_brightwellii.AAC.2